MWTNPLFAPKPLTGCAILALRANLLDGQECPSYKGMAIAFDGRLDHDAAPIEFFPERNYVWSPPCLDRCQEFIPLGGGPWNVKRNGTNSQLVGRGVPERTE
jgi:hypothetical protein